LLFLLGLVDAIDLRNRFDALIGFFSRPPGGLAGAAGMDVPIAVDVAGSLMLAKVHV